ncbi:flagellar basal body P-ring protein FlgI [Chitiniphilus shinanonensis]|uniref:flagellar basal body P-ring protein FlgI n=1 Tax=Chitiniphilus shinanonensis TaxID=553088 RepID=UPI0012F8AC99|nr:flagellar basal body P-ring protein FlgI [Chitiniphilus shinanonensis]
MANKNIRLASDFLMRNLPILIFIFSSICSAADLQLRSIGRFEGWKENYLSGIGLVSGLAGSGDSPRSKATRQALANLLSRFDLSVSDSQILSRNVASVIVTATLPAVSRAGDRVDVTVTSMGDAKSLAGGSLLVAPLKGPNGVIYCLAQGAVNVGGFKVEANQTVEQKNYPTVGIIPGGCAVEQGTLSSPRPPDGKLRFLLNNPDYLMANQVASKIRASVSDVTVVPRDAGLVEVQFSESLSDQRLVELIAGIQAVRVEPINQVKIVVNERSGVVVAGANTVISPITISHSGLRISVTTTSIVTQPLLVIDSPGTRATVEKDSRIAVSETSGAVITRPGNTIADLVGELNRQHVTARDMIAILQAIKASGALYADILVQ